MDSGTASSRIWRTLNACASVVLALLTARLNGSVCAAPNSSTARANSLSLVRTALSTSTTIALERSSSASIGTAANAFGSDGSTRWAAANSASRRLRRRRRVHHHSTRIARAKTASAIRRPNQLTPAPADGPVEVDAVFSPLAAATAAPVQSSSTQRGFDGVALQGLGVGLAHDVRIGTWNA